MTKRITKPEAEAAMAEGKRVAHRFFCAGEWMTMYRGTEIGFYVFEDDCICDYEEFWQLREGPDWYTGWYVLPEDEIEEEKTTESVEGKVEMRKLYYLTAIMATILGLAFCSQPAAAAEFEGMFGYVGMGYKLDEREHLEGEPFGRNPTARFGVYGEWDNGVSVGIDHHSQWRDGAPFNDRDEYHKTELFIDYKFPILGNKK